MNITFMIGNGFDINLGLKTRYTDFYPYYLSKNHEDMISQSIAENYDRWADLELALGELLFDVPADAISYFLDCKAELEADLADYLRSEEKRIDVSSATVLKEFQTQVSGFYKAFSTKDSREYLAWQKTVAEPFRYEFISFNYTNALDSIVEPAKNIPQFSTHSTNISIHTDVVGNVLHLHGTLSSNLILALDNPKQIANPILQDESELTNYIIKSTINDALGEGNTQAAKELIDSSDYVCIYGMSLGATDLMWWKYLVLWLDASPRHRLVLYVHAKATTNPSAPEKLRQQNKWKTRFFQTAEAKKEVAEKLWTQIIVLPRSKIFAFSDIKLSRDEAELASV